MKVTNKLKDHKSCLFCAIVKNEQKAWKIYEDELVLCFLDINPIEQGHCLIIAKKCHLNILSLADEELLAMGRATQKIIKTLQKKLQVQDFNIINNFGKIAGQIIDHYHIHVIPKYKKAFGLSCNRTKNFKKSDLREV